MNRITDKQLRIVSARIAKLLNRPGGRNVGALLIEPGSKINGITWKLSEITNERGGEHELLRATSARELFDRMLAFEAGIEAGRGTP